MQRWLVLIIGFLLVVLGYTTIDLPITLYFAKAPKYLRQLADIVNTLTAPEVNLTAWPVLFFCFFYLLRKKKTNFLIFFVIAVPTCILSVDILKVIFGRARPEEWLRHGIYGFTWLGTKQKYFSFPSAHAATIGAVMGVLASFRPKATPLWLTLALVVSFARVIGLEHYFSDIVAGVLISFFLSQGIFKMVKERKKIEVL